MAMGKSVGIDLGTVNSVVPVMQVGFRSTKKQHWAALYDTRAGMGTGNRGDEYVQVKIGIPRSISQQEKDIYQRLADLKSTGRIDD